MKAGKVSKKERIGKHEKFNGIVRFSLQKDTPVKNYSKGMKH